MDNPQARTVSAWYERQNHSPILKKKPHIYSLGNQKMVLGTQEASHTQSLSFASPNFNSLKHKAGGNRGVGKIPNGQQKTRGAKGSGNCSSSALSGAQGALHIHGRA